MRAWDEKRICKNGIQPVKGPVKKLKTEGLTVLFCYEEFWNNIAFSVKKHFNTSTEI